MGAPAKREEPNPDLLEGVSEREDFTAKPPTWLTPPLTSSDVLTSTSTRTRPRTHSRPPTRSHGNRPHLVNASTTWWRRRGAIPKRSRFLWAPSPDITAAIADRAESVSDRPLLVRPRQVAVRCRQLLSARSRLAVGRQHLPAVCQQLVVAPCQPMPPRCQLDRASVMYLLDAVVDVATRLGAALPAFAAAGGLEHHPEVVALRQGVARGAVGSCSPSSSESSRPPRSIERPLS
jgi:hypothetical protein